MSRAIGAVLRAGARGLQDAEDAGRLLTEAVQLKVSQPGPSRPGEPPGMNTGVYRAAWTFRVTEGVGRWELAVFADPAALKAGGHPDLLSTWLEFGTSKMDARPHLRPTVHEQAAALSRVAAVGVERRQRLEARSRGGAG